MFMLPQGLLALISLVCGKTICLHVLIFGVKRERLGIFLCMYSLERNEGERIAATIFASDGCVFVLIICNWFLYACVDYLQMEGDENKRSFLVVNPIWPKTINWNQYILNIGTFCYHKWTFPFCKHMSIYYHNCQNFFISSRHVDLFCIFCNTLALC